MHDSTLAQALRRSVIECLGTFTLVAIGPGAAIVMAQCAGAIAASAVLGWILGPVGNFGATVSALPTAQAFAVEMGYTGILAFVIMGVATDERTPPAVAPFVIGATVCCGALTTGALTGCSFNAARSLGPAVVGGTWTTHWLYWLGPIFGMVIGMHLYEALRASRPDAGAGAPAIGTEGALDL